MARVLGLLEEAELPGGVRLRLKTMRPVLVNGYLRTYFGSSDGRYRVTLDTGSTYRTVGLRGGLGSLRCAAPQTILELKYGIEDDDDAEAVMRHLHLRQTKSSKYVNGVILLGMSPDYL